MLENEIHVLVCDLESYKSEINRFLSYLTAEKANNSNRYYSPWDKERYILRYGIYRTILSKYLHQYPSEIALCTAKNGKPFIKDNQINISFSSTQQFCAIALGQNMQLGVDIEPIKYDSEYRQMAKMFFSEEENKFLERISDEKLTEAFLKIWTAKEAFIKANKIIDPAEFTISFSDFPDKYNTLFIEQMPWYFYNLENHFELIVNIASNKPKLKINKIDYDLLSFSNK